MNAKDNYGIKDDIYLSVPLKFDEGEFFFIKNYKFSPQVSIIIADIIQVLFIFLIKLNKSISIYKKIFKDTKKRIAAAYKDELYIKNNKEPKLSIPNVIFD